MEFLLSYGRGDAASCQTNEAPYRLFQKDGTKRSEERMFDQDSKADFDAGMNRLRLLIALSLGLTPQMLRAQDSKVPDKIVTTAIQTEGLSSAEAADLAAKLADAQTRLRNGEPLMFALLSGAPASYPMAGIAPREAFIALPLDRTLRFERKSSSSKLWRPYRLIILPEGPGKLLWDVEVVLGFNGQIERIEMLYRPPAPF